MEHIKEIIRYCNRKELAILLVFSIFMSIIETAGISLIMPFISVISDPEYIQDNSYTRYLYDLTKMENELDFILAIGIFLILFYIFRGIVNVVYVYQLNLFTSATYKKISNKLFLRYLSMPYKGFSMRNQSSMTKSIINEAINLSDLSGIVLITFSEVFIFLIIYSIMLYVNYQVTLIITVVLLLSLLSMKLWTSKRITESGLLRAESQKSFYEILSKSFGNFKLIKFQSNQDLILDDFNSAGEHFKQSTVTSRTLSGVPRIFLESLSFVLVVFIILLLLLISPDKTKDMLPIVSLFVVSLYRLMPSVSRIMNGYNNFLYKKKSIDIVKQHTNFDIENLGDDSIGFSDNVTLKNISFRYDLNSVVFQNINLCIKKGEHVGLIGGSGSGKSTLVDIIGGIYHADKGSILVDGINLGFNNIKQWRKKIGYVPQSFHLFDGTIGENIALYGEYNKDKVDAVMKKANIYDFFQKRNGQSTRVGENGTLLSGGQSQRVAIARALYTDPEILILDEATSALDTDIEKKIMKEIYNECVNMTLIIIAHRYSTLNKCNKIYRVNKKGIELISYNDLV